jgi:hypothetical protein
MVKPEISAAPRTLKTRETLLPETLSAVPGPAIVTELSVSSPVVRTIVPELNENVIMSPLPASARTCLKLPVPESFVLVTTSVFGLGMAAVVW